MYSKCGVSIASSAVVAKQIELDFLVNGSKGSTEDPPRRRNANIVRNLPSVAGSDMSANPLSTRQLVPATDEAVDSGVENNVVGETPVPPILVTKSRWTQLMDMDQDTNAIKITGQPVDLVMAALVDVSQYKNESILFIWEY